jgi:hypothetical protein
MRALLVVAALVFVNSAGWAAPASFEAIENAEQLTDSLLATYVDVESTSIDLENVSDQDTEGLLWTTFANNPHERSFRHVTTTRHEAKWELFAAQLVGVAQRERFVGRTLRASLDALRARLGGPRIPVAAYLARKGSIPIWIVIMKWEGASPDHPMAMSHVDIVAVNAVTQKTVGRATCQ